MSRKESIVPFFDPDDVAALTLRRADAEQVLDLRGVSVEDARAAVQRLLDQRRFSTAATLLVLIDPAGPQSGKTLFLPVGRQLLDARRRGVIAAVAPLADPAGGGFFVITAGRGRDAD